MQHFHRYFKACFFVATLLWTILVYGQKDCKCESIISNEEVLLLNERDSLEVFRIVNLYKNLKNDFCSFESLILEFQFYCSAKKLTKARNLLDKIEQVYNKMDCNISKYKLFSNQALYYRTSNNYEKLSEFAFKSLKEAERIKDKTKEIEALKNIVYLFTRMKEGYKNWNYVKRAEKLILSQGNAIESIKNQQWLALEYEHEYTLTNRKTLIDSALVFIDYAKKEALKYNLNIQIAQLYRCQESFSYHKGELNNALKYIDSAIHYAKKIKGVKNIGPLYMSKAWDHLDLGQLEEANKWMDTALFYERPNKGSAGYMMMLSEASEIYKGAGESDKALSSFKAYSKTKDSIINLERLEVVNELETKYKTELKDAQIKRQGIWFVIAILVFFLILFIGTIIQLKKTKQKNLELKQAFDKQLALEKELTEVRDNIAQDFHDDLGNRLARISLLSNLVNKEVLKKDDKIKLKVKQITDDSNELYAGTRDFIFSLKSNSNSLIELATYLSDFGEDYFNKTKIKFVLENRIKQDKKLPYYWVKQLVYIYKEAMTNALKYSECDMLILKFEFVNNVLVIACVDNGIGMEEANLKSNNGLLNMKNRALKIGGALSIETEKDKGTTIQFSIITT